MFYKVTDLLYYCFHSDNDDDNDNDNDNDDDDLSFILSNPILVSAAFSATR